jgi:hypothetical protein
LSAPNVGEGRVVRMSLVFCSLLDFRLWTCWSVFWIHLVMLLLLLPTCDYSLFSAVGFYCHDLFTSCVYKLGFCWSDCEPVDLSFGSILSCYYCTSCVH